MSRAFPFLRPPADTVNVGPWSRLTADGGDPLPETLMDWDYDTTLSLFRPLTIDGARARRAGGLADGSELDLTVQWFASSSALRGRAWRCSVPDVDGFEAAVAFDLPGGDLGGTLELVTSVTLRAAAAGSSAAAAARPGSVLWSDRFRVLLQGDNTLFPIAPADFHDLPYPTGAGWYLHIDEDLEAAALGSLLLLVNERHDVVMQALDTAASPTEADRRVLSTLRSDVLRVMVEHALTHEDLSDEVDYPPGSLGALLLHVVRNAFPSFSLEAMRRERRTAPALFSSRIQAASNLLVGP